MIYDFPFGHRSYERGKKEIKIKNLRYFCFAIDVSTIYYRRLNHRENISFYASPNLLFIHENIRKIR